MAEMKISSTMVNDAEDGTIAYARQIKDETQGKFQTEINAELKASIEGFSPGGDGIGLLAIELDEETGILTAVSGSELASISDESQINPVTGEIELVFDF